MVVSGTPARLRSGLSRCSSLSCPPTSPRLLRGMMCLLMLAGALATALAPRAAWAQVAAQANLTLSVTAFSPQAGQITLQWPGDSNAVKYTVSRAEAALVSNGGYSQIGTVAGTSPNPNNVNSPIPNTSFTDTTAVPGTTYEYKVTEQAGRNNFSYTVTGIVDFGIVSSSSLVESRGTVVLVVDTTFTSQPVLYPNLISKLARLQQDLVGDGWTVLRHDVARDAGMDNSGVLIDRGAGVRNVKSLIRADYTAQAATNPVKAVFLFGHVPVPYSGNVAPDGDAYFHKGAWPCDLYYGDMGPESNWTDTTVDITTANDVRNYNVPGDGKFDQSTPPDTISLEVGRVDLDNLPDQNAAAAVEEGLLEQYLDKDHNYRQGFLSALPEGRLAQQHTYSPLNATNPDDFFGSSFVFSSQVNDQSEPYANGLSNYLADTTFGSFQLSNTSAGSFQWSYIGSDGNYTSLGILGTNNFLSLPGPQSLFYQLATDNGGSQYGDWDHPGDVMRAVLGSGYGLSSNWENPNWDYSPVASGTEIGSGALNADNSNAGIWPALMGDPTLRLQVVSPPSGLTAVDNGTPGGAVNLSWAPTPDPKTVPLSPFGGSNVGYNVYRAPASTTAPASGSPTAGALTGAPEPGTLYPTGPFVKLNSVPILGTGTSTVTYQDTTQNAGVAPDQGTWVYQVRAVNVVFSGTTAYQNQSQGIYQDYLPGETAPTVQITGPANFEQPNGAIYNPTNGALFTASTNTSVTVVANATAQTNATIKYVDFYINGSTTNDSTVNGVTQPYMSDTYLGRATGAPYEATIPMIATAGLYWLTAVATDSNGLMTTSQTVRLYVIDPLSLGTVYNGALQNGWIDGTYIYPFNATAQGNAVGETGGAGSITFKTTGAVITLRHAPINTANYANLYVHFSVTTAVPNTTTGPFYPTIQVSVNQQNLPLVAEQIKTQASNGNTVDYYLPLTGFLGTGSGYQQGNLDNITITDVDPNGSFPVTGVTVQPITVSNIYLYENGVRPDQAPSVIIRSLTDNVSGAVTAEPQPRPTPFYSAPHSITLLADAAGRDASLAQVDPSNTEVDLYEGTYPNGTYISRGKFVPASVSAGTVKAPVPLRPVLGGTVTGAGGSALAGATVTVTGNFGNTQTFTTGASQIAPDGGTTNYLSTASAPPSAGTYTVTVTEPGYASQTKTGVTIANGQFTRVNFALARNSIHLSTTAVNVFGGNVTSAGAQVTGATVTVTDVNNNFVAGFTTGGSQTAPDNNPANYLSSAATPLPPGTYTVTVNAPGDAPQVATGVTIANGQFTRADFVLVATGTTPAGSSTVTTTPLTVMPELGGNVTPVGATVTVTDANSNTVATLTAAGSQAAPDGGTANYLSSTTPPLPAGTYTVTVTASGYASQSAAVTLGAGQFARADFTLAAYTPSVTNTPLNTAPVLGGNVTGLAGVLATLTVTDSNSNTVATYTTGTAQNGTAYYQSPTSPALPAGTYTVTLNAPGYVSQTATGVTLQTSMFTEVDFALQRNYSSYQFPISPTAGSHTYYVTATDTLGAVGVSAPVAVTIYNNFGGLIQGTSQTGATPVTAALTGATVVPKDSNGNILPSLTSGANVPIVLPDGSTDTVNYQGTLPAGTYTLTVSAPGYITQTVPAAGASPASLAVTGTAFTNVPITLLADPSLGGLVSGLSPASTTAQPLPGATVALLNANGTPVLDGTGNAFTFTTGASATAPDGAQANYLSATVPPAQPLPTGSYNLQVSAAGYVTQLVPVTLTGGTFTRANVTLSTIPSLGGLVKGLSPAASQPQPLAGATVTLLNGSNTTVATYTTAGSSVNAPDGNPANYLSAATPVLTAGNYTLKFTASGYIPQTVPVTLTNGQFTRADITLATYPVVLGLVSDASSHAPLAGATVAITDAAGNSVANLTTTAPTKGADGQFINYPQTTLTTATPGVYTFTVSLAGRGSVIKKVTPQPGVITRVDLSLPSPPTLQGYITDVTTGAAIANASVALLDSSGNPVDDSSGNPIVLLTKTPGTGTDGQPVNYSGVVPPGSYTLSVSAPGYVTTTATQVVAAVGAVTRRNFALQMPPSQLGGLVTDSVSGLSTSGATVTAISQTGGVTTFTTAGSSSGPDGNPVNYLGNLAAGTYTVKATTTADSSPVQTVVITAHTFTRADFALVPRLASVTVAPASESGGTTVSGTDPATGTVTLQGVAPTGGVVVTLASSGTGSTTVPASVTVPAGASSVTFPVTTSPVVSAATVTITASLNGDTRTATLTVNPAVLIGLALNPTTVVAGTPSTGTVTIGSPAPTGGLTVTLAAASATGGAITVPVTVPASVTIAAGATSATFPVTTSNVTVLTTVNITASFGTVSKTATLAVQPANLPVGFTLTINPSSVVAGNPSTGTVTLGTSASAATTITLSSDGPAAVVPASVVVPQGASSATFTIHSGNVTSSTTAHITAALAGSAIAEPLTVTPNAGLTYPAGFNMISLPYNYGAASLASVFGFSPVQIDVYNPSVFNYNYPSAPTTVPPPGQGFFVYFPKATTVTQVGTPVDQTQPFTIHLAQGWNQIGDPFLTPVPVSSLTFVSGSTTENYTQASTVKPVLLGGLDGYTPNGNYYTVNAGQSLAVGQGYWIYAYQATNLVMPAAAQAAVRQAPRLAH